jgi:hypothetical protein
MIGIHKPSTYRGPAAGSNTVRSCPGAVNWRNIKAMIGTFLTRKGQD